MRARCARSRSRSEVVSSLPFELLAIVVVYADNPWARFVSRCYDNNKGAFASRVGSEPEKHRLCAALRSHSFCTLGGQESFASRCQGGTPNEYVTRGTLAHRSVAAELCYPCRRKKEIPGRPWIDLDLIDITPLRNARAWTCARECANRWAYDSSSLQPSRSGLWRRCVGADQSATIHKSRVGSQGRAQWRADQ